MKPGDRIRNIYELRDAASEKRSVIAPWYSAGEPKPHPAAFALNMNATSLERMFRTGLFVYGKEITEYTKQADLPEPDWKTLYEKQVRTLDIVMSLHRQERDKWLVAVKYLAEKLQKHIGFHHAEIGDYLSELAQIEAGLI